MEGEEFKRMWAARIAGYEAAEQKGNEVERSRTPDDRFHDLRALRGFLSSCPQQPIAEREAETQRVRADWNRLRVLYARR